MNSTRVREKRENQKLEEAAGNVVDSMGVRLALMAKVDSGEISLEDAQAELRRIKRGAKASGKITRNQAFLRG